MYVTILVFVLVGVSALLNFGYAFLTKTSYQSVFSSFNFLQIVLLIPLTEVYLATKVSNLIEVMKPALLSFFYFKWDNVGLDTDLIEECEYAQPNSSLRFIGLESGSTLVNIYAVCIFFWVLVFLHMIICFLYCCGRSKPNEGCWRRFVNYISWVFKFSIYIRYILESTMVVVLASISELERLKMSGIMKFRSYISAISALGVVITILVFFLFHWLKYGKDEEMDSSSLRHWYSGLKQSRWSRLFNHIFMLRRIIFVLLLIFLYSEDTTIRISCIVSVQALYCIWLVIFRPFANRKDNILEIIHEVGYLIVTGALIYYQKENVWGYFEKYAFWGWIVGILSFSVLISTCKHDKIIYSLFINRM